MTVALHVMESQSLIKATRTLIRVMHRKGLHAAANGFYGIPEAEYDRHPTQRNALSCVGTFPDRGEAMISRIVTTMALMAGTALLCLPVQAAMCALRANLDARYISRAHFEKALAPTSIQ